MRKFDVIIRLTYKNGLVKKVIIPKHGETPNDAEEFAVSSIEQEFFNVKTFEVVKVVPSKQDI